MSKLLENAETFARETPRVRDRHCDQAFESLGRRSSCGVSDGRPPIVPDKVHWIRPQLIHYRNNIARERFYGVITIFRN